MSLKNYVPLLNRSAVCWLRYCTTLTGPLCPPLIALLSALLVASLAMPPSYAQPMPAPSFRRAESNPGLTQPGSAQMDEGVAHSKMLYGQVGNLSLEAEGDPPNLSLRLPRTDDSMPTKSPAALNAERLAAFVDRNQEPMAVVKVSETARFLSKYDVELIVDASMSMRKRDCPGFLSRWDWCGYQSIDLAHQLAPFASQGITLTSFNRNFTVYEHQNPQQLTTLFERTPLALNTRLAEPLADRLNDYVVHRGSERPRLIAVITDGVPHPFEQVQMVEDVLVHASKMIKDPRELTVVFFQIGSRDLLGQEFLGEIDNKLVARGARFDIVQTVSFEHLQQVGLAQGLADAIRSFDYKTRN